MTLQTSLGLSTMRKGTYAGLQPHSHVRIVGTTVRSRSPTHHALPSGRVVLHHLLNAQVSAQHDILRKGITIL